MIDTVLRANEAIMICQSAGVISVGHGILGRRGDGGGGSCGTMTRGDAGLGLIGEPKPAAVPCVPGVRGGVCAYAPRSCGGEPMALRGRPCGCGVPPGPSSDAPPMLPRRAGSNTQTQRSDAAAALARVSRGLSAAARFRRGRRYSLLIRQKGLAAPPANPSRVAPKGQCRALRAPAAGARAPGTPGPRAPAQKARQAQAQRATTHLESFALALGVPPPLVYFCAHAASGAASAGAYVCQARRTGASSKPRRKGGAWHATRLLAARKWQVAVLDHVLDLPLHGEHKEHDLRRGALCVSARAGNGLRARVAAAAVSRGGGWRGRGAPST